MTNENKLQLFEDSPIRSVWDGESEEWFFSVVDIVGALIDAKDFLTARKYWNKLKQRLTKEGNETVTKCRQLKLPAKDGKARLTDVANTEQILRLIQSVPSKKAEPIKLWLAEVGKDRIEETIDPEKAIDRATETYLKKGYSEDWIHQRLMSIRVRNGLTEEWRNRGVKRGKEYAILTDDISRAWSEMTTREYKNLKGLKKENLRDNMTDMELVLTMLSEVSTTEISKTAKPKTLEENRTVAKAGGNIAGDARKAIEAKTGKSVISKKNATELGSLMTNLLEAPMGEEE